LARRFKWGPIGERFLRNVLIVEDGIAVNGRGHLFTTVEVCGGQDVADAAVEAFNHAVGLWMSRRDQAMLNAKQYALPIEDMLARRLVLLAGEAISEWAAVVGWQLYDLDRRSRAQAPRKSVLLTSL